MPTPFRVQDVEGTQYVESLAKKLSTATELLKAFPDLVIREYNSKEIFYYSKSVNDKVQDIEFTSEIIGYNSLRKHICVCKYFFDLKGEIIEIRPEVGQIPLFEYTEFNSSTGAPASVHYFSFEDSFKKMKTPKLLVGKTRLYIISELEKLQTNGAKINHFWMPESIKKLMPFT